MRFEVLITPPESAEANMLRDEQLLQSLEKDPHIILHFYQWLHPSLTYGYFIKPDKYLNINGLKKWKFDSARRPTGGGIILHPYDLAFSFLMPSTHRAFSMNTLENYAAVNHAILEAINLFRRSSKNTSLLTTCAGPPKSSCSNFCMAQPTKFDVMIDGKKAAGGAQRRTKYGLLHQASICLTQPPKECLGDILLDDEIAIAMKRWTYPLISSSVNEVEKTELKQKLQLLLFSALRKNLFY